MPFKKKDLMENKLSLKQMVTSVYYLASVLNSVGKVFSYSVVGQYFETLCLRVTVSWKDTETPLMLYGCSIPFLRHREFERAYFKSFLLSRQCICNWPIKHPANVFLLHHAVGFQLLLLMIIEALNCSSMFFHSVRFLNVLVYDLLQFAFEKG